MDDEALIILAHDRPQAAQSAQKKLEADEIHVRQRYGLHVLIVAAPAHVLSKLESDLGVAGVYREAVPDEARPKLDDTGNLGIAAWNQRHSEAFRQAKSNRKGEGLAWDDPNFESEGRQEP
jgi:hypothetical protein